MSEANKALVRSWIDGLNKRDLTVIDRFFDADFVYHRASAPDLKGREALKQFVSLGSAACPDIVYTVEDQVAEGDKVATRWRMEGTQSGPFMGIAPTGKRTSVEGMVIARIADGKIAEGWEIIDTLGLMQQIGALPRRD